MTEKMIHATMPRGNDIERVLRAMQQNLNYAAITALFLIDQEDNAKELLQLVN